jgi:hypothetical protein
MLKSSPFFHTGLGIHQRNLLEARMIITAYNQHARLLPPSPLVWFAPPKSTPAWEPTLLWNHYAHNRMAMSVIAWMTTVIFLVCNSLEAGRDRLNEALALENLSGHPLPDSAN